MDLVLYIQKWKSAAGVGKPCPESVPNGQPGDEAGLSTDTNCLKVIITNE